MYDLPVVSGIQGGRRENNSAISRSVSYTDAYFNLSSDYQGTCQNRIFIKDIAKIIQNIISFGNFVID